MPTTGRRRAYGQHFLKDQTIARAIAQSAVDEARKHACAALLEIGPGKGAITDPILEAKGDLPLLLCEKDRGIASHWQGEVAHQSGLSVETADFLELPEEKWLARKPLAVVSNLPYSSGTAILLRLAAHSDAIPVMVLMFQAEVARRLRAEASTKAWGSLSIWIQNLWDVKKSIAVPPRAFQPPPQVDSEVVILTRRETPRVPVTDPALWEKLLKVSFAHRRKMLRSSLPAGSRFRQALDAAGLDGAKRAEALEWDEWARFYTALGDRDA